MHMHTVGLPHVITQLQCVIYLELNVTLDLMQRHAATAKRTSSLHLSYEVQVCSGIYELRMPGEDSACH